MRGRTATSGGWSPRPSPPGGVSTHASAAGDAPGETLIIDWGEQKVAGRTVKVLCAVLAWARWRFVRFAADEKAATTLGMLAECFEALGGCRRWRSPTGWAA